MMIGVTWMGADPNIEERRQAILFGASGHGRAVRDVLARAGWQVVTLVDPDEDVGAETTLPILGSDEEGCKKAQEERLAAVVAIGDNQGRLTLVRLLVARSIQLPPVVARTATVASDAELGPGTVVMEHAHVGPQCRLGAGCIINTHAIVEHDGALGDGVHIAPGAVLGGGASCGPQVLVGTGAAVLPLVHVGSAAVVGAGAVVTSPVQEGTIVIGVPARQIANGWMSPPPE